MPKKMKKQLNTTEDLTRFYWIKKELIKFCKLHHLPTQGGKLELINRIRIYLQSGESLAYKNSVKEGEKDSLKPITKTTLVKNYNNDLKTRTFFIEQIGNKFKFNTYLRQFTDSKKIEPNMTYGDLIDGYIVYEKYKSENILKIGAQFEYNQFIRDFFQNEVNTSLQKAITAWKKVVKLKGPRTYIKYKENF